MADLHDVTVMGNRLLEKHGLGRVNFGFHDDPRGVGYCQFDHRTLEPKIIALSKPIVSINSLFTAKQILLHEIAHGHAGYREDHGPLWMKIAADLGVVNPSPCYDSGVMLVPQGKWNAYCPECSFEHPMFSDKRRPENFENLLCPHHNIRCRWLPLGRTLREEMQIRGLDKPRVNGAY